MFQGLALAFSLYASVFGAQRLDLTCGSCWVHVLNPEVCRSQVVPEEFFFILQVFFFPPGAEKVFKFIPSRSISL